MQRDRYAKNLSILNVAVVAWLGACATDDRPVVLFESEPTWDRAGAGATTADARPERDSGAVEPFELEFPALISQPVRWASVDVRITKARQLRGASDELNPRAPRYVFEQPVFLDPEQIYVELTLSIANKSSKEVDYNDKINWDLKLANGARLVAVDRLGVSVLPADEATAVLYYEVDAVVDLAGAALVLEGNERGRLEPEVLPLDVAYVPAFPRRIASLVGKQASYRDENWAAQLQVDEAVYDINAARVGRAFKETRCVWFRIAATAGTSVLAFSTDELRVAVDGRASGPREWDYGSVQPNATRVFFAAFDIPTAAERFDLVIPNGSQPPTRLPVEIATDAVLATDIP